MKKHNGYFGLKKQEYWERIYQELKSKRKDYVK